MKSEWIMDMGEVWICRNCGEPCKEHFMGKPRWNYCPWCGADMRAEQTEPNCQECMWCADGEQTCPNPNLCYYAPKQTEPSTDCGWK